MNMFEKLKAAMSRPRPAAAPSTEQRARNVNISCVVDDQPRFRMQAWNWLVSLAALETRCRIFIHYVPGALGSKTQAEFRALGATLVEISPFGEAEARYCNKLRQLETPELTEGDFVILSDADLVFLRDPAVLPRSGQFRAKTVDLASPPEAVWSELFRRAGLADKITTVPLEMKRGQKTFGTNFNGGLYVMPGATARMLSPLWQKHARFCLEQGDLLGDRLLHSDQLGMGLALAESGQSIEPLPTGANLPTHLPKKYLSRIPRQDIIGIHYHGHWDQHGLPRDVGVRWIDAGIGRVRDILVNERRKGFSNDIFWDFRYEQFPELGSGVGSRDEPLAYKQRMLRPYIEMIGAESILDVGCGDLEVFAALPAVNYTGIDVSERALSIAREKRPEWTFEMARVTDFEADSYDYTFCIDVLIHQPNQAAAQALARDLVRVARRGVIFSAHSEAIDGSGISFNSSDIRDYIASMAEISEVNEIGRYRDVTVYLAAKAGR